MCYASDLSSLVSGCALVDALILWESTSYSQNVHTLRGRHLEVLGWLDDLVVVVPLHNRVCNQQRLQWFAIYLYTY